MNSSRSARPLLNGMILYAVSLVILDIISGDWGLPPFIVVPFVLIGQVLWIILMPRKRARLFASILLVFSLLAFVGTAIVLAFGYNFFDTHPNYGLMKLINGLILVLGVAPWLFAMKHHK